MRRNRAIALLLFLGLVGACATTEKVYPRNPLAEQILRPRPGYKGLTNAAKVCKPDAAGKEVCALEVQDHDMSDAAFRLELRNLKFVCNVNERLFRIAQDYSALIRETYSEPKCFLWKCKERELLSQEFINFDAAGYQRMLNANTHCHSLEHYPFSMKDGL